MSSEHLKQRLTHTEGGHAWDKRYSEDDGQIVTDCRVCDELLLVSHGKREEADEKLKLTFIESTEERLYERHHEGHFCSVECLIEFLSEMNQE